MYIVFCRFKWKPPYIVSVTWPSSLHGYLNLKIIIVIKQQICPFITISSWAQLMINVFFFCNKVFRHHYFGCLGPISSSLTILTV